MRATTILGSKKKEEVKKCEKEDRLVVGRDERTREGNGVCAKAREG